MQARLEAEKVNHSPGYSPANGSTSTDMTPERMRSLA